MWVSVSPKALSNMLSDFVCLVSISTSAGVPDVAGKEGGRRGEGGEGREDRGRGGRGGVALAASSISTAAERPEADAPISIRRRTPESAVESCVTMSAGLLSCRNRVSVRRARPISSPIIASSMRVPQVSV